MSDIAGQLERVRRSIKLAAAMRGALLVGAMGCGIVVLSLVLDRVFRLGVPARTILLLIYVAGASLALWRFFLRPFLFRISEGALADIVERNAPGLEDRLRSAIDFLRDPRVRSGADSDDLEIQLKQRVVREAEALSGDLAAIDVIDRRNVHKATLLASATLLVIVGIFSLSAPGTAGLWLKRNVLLGQEEWPYRTVLLVHGFAEDGHRGVARGDPLEIQVTAIGEVPDRVLLDLDFASDRRRYNLARLGEREFRHLHPEVREPFEFRLRGGDYRSRYYQVEVLERPRIDSLGITLVFPAHTGMEPETRDGAAGELAIPVGTELRIEALATKSLTEAALVYGERVATVQIDPDDRRRFRGQLKPVEGGLLSFRYRDVEGVIPDSPVQIQVRLIPDQAPKLKLRPHGIGSMVSAEARIPLKIEVTDDYSIEEVVLEHRVFAREEKSDEDTDDEEQEDRLLVEGETPLKNLKRGPLIETARSFEVRDLGLEPEKRLVLQVRATDNNTLKGPNTGRSSAFEFIVVTHQRLMDDFLRRQEAQRQAFERLLERQRSIRDALYTAIDAGLKKEGDLEAATSRGLATHARDERSLARQMLGIASAIEAILTEMKNNRVGEADDIGRIGQKVVTPLREVATTDLPEISTRFLDLRNIPAAPDRVSEGLALAETLDLLIERLEKIRANMVKLESFSEIVNLLRNILELQSQSRAEAQKAYERLLEDSIFEDEN